MKSRFTTRSLFKVGEPNYKLREGRVWLYDGKM
jgi:hypothetical protein